jgi:Carboxypeptidase regulatory-like domain
MNVILDWKRDIRLLLAIGALISFIPLLRAQTTNATLSGVVTDESGAVVSHAQIVVTLLATGEQRTAESSDAGAYSLAALPIGTYSISATAPGFKRLTIPSVTLQVGQAASLDLKLAIGAVSEVVTVSEQLPLMNSASSSVSQVVENRSIQSIALNGRQFWQLTALTPGASYTPGGQQIARGGAGVRSSSVNVNINGTNSTFTGWQLDGFDITDFEAGGTNIQVNVDALQEFRVMSATAPAEYGHVPVIVNASLKSGTNQFHGEVFEFLRNDYIDANNYFNRTGTKNALRRNQFGGTIGGPIWRDRIFFFTDIERTLQTQDNVFADIVPSNSMRNTTTGAMFPEAITNPYTGKPFPSNVIPSSMISPQALFFLRYLPTQAQSNFVALQTVDIYKADLKIDADLTKVDRLSGRYSINDNQEADPNQFPALGTQNLGARAQNFGLTETHVFSPKWLNELRAGYTRDGINFRPVLPGQEFTQAAGINGYQQSELSPSFPYMTLSGYSAFDGSGLNNLPKIISVRYWQYGDSASYTSGKHQVKLGAQLYHRSDRFIIGQSQEGMFAFTTRFTGDAFGDFLLGLPNSALRSYPLSNYGVYANVWSGFAQDDWQISPNLTLNLGLRYEMDPFFNAMNGQMGAWNGTEGNVIIPTKNGGQLIVPAAQAVVPTAYPLYSDRLVGTDQIGLPQSIRKDGVGLFAPRFGFALKALPNGRAVVRGAYGLFPVFIDTNLAINWTKTPPFLISQTANNGLTANMPTFTWADPFLGQSIIAPNTAGAVCPGTTTAFKTCVTPALYSAPPTLQHTYEEEWNLAVQTELSRDVSVTLAYVGDRTVHAQDNGILTNVPAAGAGAIQTRRQYAQWGQVNLTLTNGAQNYNSFQGTIEKRFSHGFQTLIAYTYSKCMDNIFTNVRPDPGYQTSYAVCDYDLRDILAVSGVYELPFGRGRMFGTNMNRALDAVAGGWEFAGVFSGRSGLPFTPTLSSDVANTGVTTETPNRIGSGKLAKRSATLWFNPAAFQAPTPNTYSPYFTRNILAADGLVDFDATVKKNIMWTAERGMELRFECFNVFNHPTFSAPTTTIGSSSAGVVNSTLNAARTFQAAAKIFF